jgi:hypothetical protein
LYAERLGVSIYASGVPYGHPDDLWSQTKIELCTMLVAKARTRSVVPYSGLVAQLGPLTFAPEDFAFHRMLDEVSWDGDTHGRGLLTVIVVHKDGDMRPGPGFFELARDRGRQVADIDIAWLEELDKVWGYWKDH